MKKSIIAILAALCLVICGCAGNSDTSGEPQETDKMATVEYQWDAAELVEEINALSFGPEIDDVLASLEEAYDALPDDIKSDVYNHDTLVGIRDDYDAAMDAVQKAIDAIDDIGDVDADSKADIDNAQNAYNAVDPLFTYLVTNSDAIETARETFRQALSDKGVEEARALIEAGKYQDAITYVSNFISENSSDLGSTTDLTAVSQEAELYWGWDLYNRNYLGYVQDIVDDLRWDTVTSELSSARDQLENTLDNYLNSVMPANGTVLSSTISGGYGELTVYTDDTPAVVKIQDVNNSSRYITLFVRAYSSAFINVPDGTYTIKYATGDKYFGDTASGPFGNDTSFYQMEGNIEYTTTQSGNSIYYKIWEVTLYSVEGGNTPIHSIDGL